MIFNRFYGDQLPKSYKQTGLGTGFIIDKEGYILTNNHYAATNLILICGRPPVQHHSQVPYLFLSLSGCI